MGRLGLVVFVELPRQAGVVDMNSLLAWRWWVNMRVGREVGRIVYHVGPLGSASDVWADIEAP
jgi:hypothetical protein